MAANGISTISSGTDIENKEARQTAKLDIAQAKRQGKMVDINGTISGTADAEKTYYRYWNTYDILTLPAPYNVDESTTSDPLVEHRPWTGNILGASVPIIAPTVNSQSDATTQPSITGTYDTNSTSFTVTIDSVTYTLGTDSELTTSGSDWTLNLGGSSQTLTNETTYDVVATSNGSISDETTNEITTVSAIAEIISDSVTTLQVWFDGSDSTQFQPTNPSDGDGILQWNDKSNLAHNANPIGTGPDKRATYETNELNTYSVVRFDGDAGLSVNPFTSLAGSSEQTIFVVAKATNLDANPQTLTSTNAGGLKFRWNGSNWIVNTAGGTGVSTITADANWHIFGLVYNGNGASDALKLKFRYDKVDQTLDFSADPGVGSTLSGSITQFNIACRDDNVEHFIGDIASVLMFNRTLSAEEIDNVENYLNIHWNLGL